MNLALFLSYSIINTQIDKKTKNKKKQKQKQKKIVCKNISYLPFFPEENLQLFFTNYL